MYLEGGGNNSLNRECREGFAKLFEKLGLTVQFVACGSRNNAFKDFKNAALSSVGSWPILLVDSEEPVSAPTKREHLTRRDPTWQFPENVTERQIQLMTTCMETWLICDRPALKEYFGQCFKESSLPAVGSIEEKDHHEVIEALEAATRDCGKDKCYNKGKHSFKLLARIDPNWLSGLTYFEEAHRAIKGHTKT